MNLPTIVPLLATETQVHRTQVTKASCPQVHGGAVGLETLPMGLPQEFKRTRPPVLEDDLPKDIPPYPQVHGLRSFQRAHLLVFCSLLFLAVICTWP